MRPILIIIIIFIIIVFIIIRYRGGKKKFPWYEFYSKGRKEGFRFKEIGFLKQIAIENKLEKPQSIFWSTKQLDRCLRPAIRKINADESLDPKERLRTATKLLELRKKAEFSLPKYQKKIRDTTALLPRQKLAIREKEYGSYISWVIEINRKYIVITQPSGQAGWQELNWVSRKVDVYFWRHDDAGYLFETKVQEQITHEEYPLLYLTHSSNLKRMQKRKSIRVETALPARFNPVVYSTVNGVKKPLIAKRRYAGKIIDLSETGCCMLAGRMLKKNDRLKIEFYLTKEKHIASLGVIVNISKTGDERVNRYHIMFVRVSQASKNNILLYVFNIFGERMEDSTKRRQYTMSVPQAPTKAESSSKTK